MQMSRHSTSADPRASVTDVVIDEHDVEVATPRRRIDNRRGKAHRATTQSTTSSQAFSNVDDVVASEQGGQVGLGDPDDPDPPQPVGLDSGAARRATPVGAPPAQPAIRPRAGRPRRSPHTRTPRRPRVGGAQARRPGALAQAPPSCRHDDPRSHHEGEVILPVISRPSRCSAITTIWSGFSRTRTRRRARARRPCRRSSASPTTSSASSRRPRPT